MGKHWTKSEITQLLMANKRHGKSMFNHIEALPENRSLNACKKKWREILKNIDKYELPEEKLTFWQRIKRLFCKK